MSAELLADPVNTDETAAPRGTVRHRGAPEKGARAPAVIVPSVDTPLFVDDPILPPLDAARYLGFRGDDPARSLRRLNLERSPMPGTGTTRYGYRRSVLNRYLAELADPHSRRPKVRTA